MKNIDIVDVKRCVKNGQLRSFVENGKIFLEDTTSGERVEIGTVSIATPSQWVSVLDKLPNADKTKNVHEQVTVIVCRNGRVSPMEYERTVVRGKTVYRWRYAWDRLCDDADSITHWMPLPEPPKQEENV